MNGIEDTFCAFEGAEKKIEIDFKRDPSNPDGLRTIPQKYWEDVLDVIKCQIISSTKNKFFDSYVLSESSLFVYPYKVLLKTCGTTILLRCLEPIIEIASSQLGLAPEFVFFSRKNFLYPDKQLHPHTSLTDEIEILNYYFDGHCYTFGPHNSEHWVFYYADLSDSSERGILHNDQTFEILMTDLDQDKMSQFFANESNLANPKEVTISSGISDFIPGAITDEKMFEPCGYSVNGLSNDNYFTIHVTPENHCSFVSFETNLASKNYTNLTSNVLDAFKPGRFTLTLFSDSDSVSGNDPLGAVDVKALQRLGYNLKNRTYSEYSTGSGYTLVYLFFESVDLDERCESPVVAEVEPGYLVDSF